MQLQGDMKFYTTSSENPGDVILSGSDLVNEPGLETSVTISLFTDARAEDDDVLPNKSDTRKGWWGDALLDQPIGSKLWLLSRAKNSDETVKLAGDYTKQALDWMVTDEVATEILVSASRSNNQIDISTIIIREGKSNIFFRYYLNWQSQIAGGL